MIKDDSYNLPSSGWGVGTSISETQKESPRPHTRLQSFHLLAIKSILHASFGWKVFDFKNNNSSLGEITVKKSTNC